MSRVYYLVLTFAIPLIFVETFSHGGDKAEHKGATFILLIPAYSYNTLREWLPATFTSYSASSLIININFSILNLLVLATRTSLLPYSFSQSINSSNSLVLVFPPVCLSTTKDTVVGYSLTESVYCGNGNLRVPFLANIFSTYLFFVDDSHLLLVSSRSLESLLNGIPLSLYPARWRVFSAG